MKVSLPELRLSKFKEGAHKVQHGADSRTQQIQYKKIFKTQKTKDRTLPHLDAASQVQNPTKQQQRKPLNCNNQFASDISFQSDIMTKEMGRFLSEEKLLLQKRKRWQSLIRKDETSLNFSQIREKIDPTKLSEYLQRKHNQQQWKKIRNREEKLYSLMEVKKPQLDQQIKYKAKITRRFHVQEDRKQRMKLKGLERLQNILMKI